MLDWGKDVLVQGEVGIFALLRDCPAHQSVVFVSFTGQQIPALEHNYSYSTGAPPSSTTPRTPPPYLKLSSRTTRILLPAITYSLACFSFFARDFPNILSLHAFLSTTMSLCDLWASSRISSDSSIFSSALTLPFTSLT